MNIINGRDKGLQCRICAEYVTHTNGKMHNIFEDNSKRNYLQSKIRKYLHVPVSLEDKLPKTVCSMCFKKLEGIHIFAKMAHRAQERLKNQLYGADDEAEEYDDNQGDGEENQGLLRLILREKDDRYQDDSSPLPLSIVHPMDDNSSPSNPEEMEVKIDPMIFLQCGLDRPISPDISENSSGNEEMFHQTKNSSSLDNDDRRQKLGRNSPTLDNRESKFDCTICSDSFDSSSSLQKHLWRHLSQLSSQDYYSDNKQLNNQRNTNSASRISFQNDHENPEEFNTATGTFTCPICNKRISTKGNLKVHLETHRPKGKYDCDICGRIFKTQSNLFRHKEYHGGIQFPCSVCGRVYPTNSTLRAHSITHSDLRPHACPLCDKTFKRNQDLKFHINQHTGARPYQCPYCPKAFASSGNCFSHRKRMHPKEVHRDRQRAADLMR